MWYLLATILFALALFILVFNFVRDRKYLKKKTSEAMDEGLWKEIEIERNKNLVLHKKFQDALDSAKKETPKR